MQVRDAFTSLNQKRWQIAKQEKRYEDKTAEDMLRVKEHCDSQMNKQSLQEEFLQDKIDAAHSRYIDARDLSRAQKTTIKLMIAEMQKDLDKVNADYLEKLSDSVQCGLYARAQKLVGEEDKKVQAKLREAAESVEMMIGEVEQGKKRLIPAGAFNTAKK